MTAKIAAAPPATPKMTPEMLVSRSSNVRLIKGDQFPDLTIAPRRSSHVEGLAWALTWAWFGLYRDYRGCGSSPG